MYSGLPHSDSDISTHTLRKEGDVARPERQRTDERFQPTPSARRVTKNSENAAKNSEISTHTLRKEGDFEQTQRVAIMLSFQPTPSARRVTIIKYM